MKKIVCISDTHGEFRGLVVPDGDILVHAGDITTYGQPAELVDFNLWLTGLPHQDKVVIAGNHDAALANQPAEFGRRVLTAAHYLQDSEVQVQDVRIYGSPWTPEFMNWHFMMPRDGWELRAKWAKIPEELDILLTHGPPANKLDYSKFQKTGVGCHLLREAVERARPRYHVFGHLHESYGGIEGEFTTFINCSIMTRSYVLANAPIVIEV
ncbi:hypothetical protein LCGC14_0823450 [marine sediment metagenome]|uniref:Calcineurin-like phosphoesterase domain-containing protein n=1 Tax=marine sediment metagenome TaxID=412755 RepID=A0A0F9Q3A8_9ZZZZ